MAKTLKSSKADTVGNMPPQQMPLWEERVRCLPNPMARSSLFCVGSKKPRRQFQNEVIASLEETTIRYTGSELRQDDESVFLQLCHLARGRCVDEMIEFSAFSMLKELEWGDSARAYQRLRECIDRLKANALKVGFNIDGKTVEFSGSLIRKFARSDVRGQRQQWKVWLEREVIVLFGHTITSEIEWSMRSKLNGELAKWLLGFFGTWDENLPAEIATLRRLCGSSCASITAYRQMLREALEQLKKVGFLHDWRTDREYVWISRDSATVINRAKPSKLLAGKGVEEVMA